MSASRQIATLYGKPLNEATDEEVARALSVAEKALDGMLYFDPEISTNWIDTIACLRAEQVKRLSEDTDKQEG